MGQKTKICVQKVPECLVQWQKKGGRMVLGWTFNKGYYSHRTNEPNDGEQKVVKIVTSVLVYLKKIMCLTPKYFAV